MKKTLSEKVVRAVFPEPLLVNSYISQSSKKNPVVFFEIFPRAVKLVRDSEGMIQPPEGGPRSEISSFSKGSKRRLKFVAANAFPSLIVQFGMTYHNLNPDGRTVKKHMNTFLSWIRWRFPEIGYLWILEFQRRGVPHFHLFLTVSHTEELGMELGEAWNRIAEPEDEEHLRFHVNPKNFIPWEMGSGSYLCKYLSKQAQKSVPLGFEGVGRFWARSRGLVPEPEVIESKYIDDKYSRSNTDISTGEIDEFRPSEFITRTISKHHEKSLKGSKWKSSARKRRTCYTLPNGAVVFNQIIKNISEKNK